MSSALNNVYTQLTQTKQIPAYIAVQCNGIQIKCIDAISWYQDKTIFWK